MGALEWTGIEGKEEGGNGHGPVKSENKMRRRGDSQQIAFLLHWPLLPFGNWLLRLAAQRMPPEAFPHFALAPKLAESNQKLLKLAYLWRIEWNPRNWILRREWEKWEIDVPTMLDPPSFSPPSIVRLGGLKS